MNMSEDILATERRKEFVEFVEALFGAYFDKYYPVRPGTRNRFYWPPDKPWPAKKEEQPT